VFFSPTWPIRTGWKLQWVFITLSEVYCYCERLSSCHHGLLNLPDTRPTTQRWQGVGRSVGPALIGQAGQKKSLAVMDFLLICLKLCWSVWISVDLSEFLLICLNFCWSVRISVDLSEFVLICLNLCWSVWICVDLSEFLLICLNFCWSVWISVDLSEFLLICLNFCWSVWIPIDLSEFPLRSIVKISSA
jgi:hypothetical protein